jgi:hypothetical protein
MLLPLLKILPLQNFPARLPRKISNLKPKLLLQFGEGLPVEHIMAWVRYNPMLGYHYYNNLEFPLKI